MTRGGGGGGSGGGGRGRGNGAGGAAGVALAAAGLVGLAGFVVGTYIIQDYERRQSHHQQQQQQEQDQNRTQRSSRSIESCQMHQNRPRTARASTRLQTVGDELLNQTLPLVGLQMLPNTVTRAIIQCVDYTSLSALSTVCKSWRRHISLVLKDKEYIKSCAWKGFSETTRFSCWQRIVRNEQTINASAELYQQLSLINDEAVPMVESIRRDVHRTLPQSAALSGVDGQDKLFRLLKAYAVNDPEVNYCQGMNFIAGFLLTQTNEQSAFSMMDCLMHDFELRWLYLPGLPHLSLCLWQLDQLTKTFMPDLHQHFKRVKVQPQLYASEWFVGLFTYTLSLSEAARVWDLFITQGWKAIFRVSLALLNILKDELLTKGFEAAVHHLKVVPRGGVINFEKMLSVANKMKVTNSLLDELETQYYAGVY